MDYNHVKKQLGYGIQTESKYNAIKAIEQLQARVAELEAENAKLHEQVDLQVPKMAFTQLKAANDAQAAVIEKLRGALIAGWSLQCDFDDAKRLADDALAIPTDSAQILDEVRRAERERVTQMILNGRFLHDESPAAQFAKEVANAIRAME